VATALDIVSEPPPRLDDPGAVVDTGKVRLWCSDVGEGEPITLLGGFTAGHHIWDFVRPHLSDYRTITLEPRGLGRSDTPAGEYGAEVWADDLRDLLQALGVERTHLWAGGFGNYYALRFAAEYPELVAGFVAYTDVWSGDEGKSYGKIWPVYKAIVDNFGTKGFGASMLAGIFHVPWLPWFNAWEAGNIEEVLHPETVERTVGYGLTKADVRDELERIQAPVLVLQGAQDYEGRTLDPDKDASLALMRERIPGGVEEFMIPDSHPGYVLAHKPEECARAARSFLAKHPL
jgi:pimeloyl-ACP methyl ester carboxylesterase